MMNRLLLEYISKLLIKESSPASQQAKQMGLSYMGFGQWGMDGKVTHKSADKDGTMLVVYTPKTEEVVDEPSKDTKKRTSYSDYPEIQPEELNAASLADKVREGIIAPGNDFSKYQEAVSIFIAKYIVDNPDASDQDIMERIVLLDCGSKLLTKDVKSTLPKKYTAEFNELKQSGVFSTCAKDYKDDQHKARFATMIFAKKKAELMISGIEKAKLVSPRIDSFSGDQDSLSSLATLVKTSTGKIYSPEGNELKKDEVIESISGFGTSKFPADTALIAIDKFGNMVFIGYSDKKDLSAIINNSTVSSEINSHIRVLDSLLNREIMDQERYDKLAGELYTLDKEYNNIESELKVATLDPANELVNISNNTPEQLTELVSRAKRLSGGKTPDKYLKKLTDAIGKAYNNKSSKVFKLWEPLLQQAGWDGTTMPTEEQMLAAFAFKSFDVLNNEDSGGWNIYPVSRGENTLTKEAQELLFRLMVPDGSPQKKEFVEKIGVIRDRSLQILAQAREELNEVTVGLEDGSSIKLGTYLDAIQAWRALHLDMGEYEGSLVMAAEDIIVGATDLIRCLRGADSYEDFAKTLDISTKRIKDKSYGTVTGQNVEIFSINPEGKKVKVGTRSIRSKDGILGKLQTTYNYHPEFQNCLRQFAGTGKLDENFNLKSSKILLEYLSSILGEGERVVRNPGDVWTTDSGYAAKNLAGDTRYGFDSKEKAEAWANKGKSPIDSENDNGTTASDNVPDTRLGGTEDDTDTQQSRPAVTQEDASSAIDSRIQMLNDAIAKQDKGTNKHANLVEYRNFLVAMKAIIEDENTTPDQKRELLIAHLESKNITSFRHIMDSPIFGPVQNAKDREASNPNRHTISSFINSNFPGILSGNYDPEDRGTLSRLSSRSMFHGLERVSDRKPDGNLTLGGTTVRKIDINDDMGATQRIDAEAHNRQVDFLEKKGTDGFFEMPQGKEGAAFIQDRLTDQLFEDEADKNKFKGLHQAWLDAPDQATRDVSWQEMQRFLQEKFPHGGVIPTVCEHLEASRILHDDETAKVFMPVAGNFPVIDVVIIRRREVRRGGAGDEADEAAVELVAVETYIIQIGAVKRGDLGAPAYIEGQMELTIYSDDEGSGESRKVLTELIDDLNSDNEESIKAALDLLGNTTPPARKRINSTINQRISDETTKSGSRLNNLIQKLIECECGDSPSKRCRNRARLRAKKIRKKQILFEMIQEKFTVKQCYTTSIYHKKGITRTDGDQTVTIAKPDYRSDCEEGKLSIKAKRAYLAPHSRGKK